MDPGGKPQISWILEELRYKVISSSFLIHKLLITSTQIADRQPYIPELSSSIVHKE